MSKAMAFYGECKRESTHASDMEHSEMPQVREYGESLNARLFEHEVEVAYHALAMAMHAAQACADVGALERIGSTAEVQARTLGDRAQSYGPEALLARATESHARIFASLAQQARSTALRLSVPRTEA
jgi:hypothetical protein